MSWFKTRDKEEPIEIECPHCETAQNVSPTIRATFCKNCGKTIYTKSAVRKGPPRKSEESITAVASEKEQVAPDAPVKQAPAAVPPPVQQTAATAAPMEKVREQPVFRPSSENQTKTIKCSYCHTSQQVPSIALASFCEKCGRRVNLQDYQIRGHFRGELETRGEIRIASEADVQGNLDVGVAIIEGRMEGEILAEVRVILEPNSLVVGTINSPALVIREGAGFVGKAAINPKEGMEMGVI